MKIDKKSTLILILFTFSVIMTLVWLNDSDDNSDYVNEMEQRVEKIKKERDSIYDVNEKLNIEFKEYSKRDSLYTLEIDSLYIELNNYIEKSEKTTEDLNKLKDRLIKDQVKLDSLYKKDYDKSDKELIKSLKNKLK